VSKIVRRVRRDLNEIADRAPLSPAARDSILARVDLSIDHSEREVIMLEKNDFRTPRRMWAAAVGIGAVAALAVAGVVIIRSGGDDAGEMTTVESVPPVIQDDATVAETPIEITVADEPPANERPSPRPTLTVLPAPESWNPILATTEAKTAPAAATCPADTNPDVAGPIGQQRPHPGWVGNLAAAFDQHTGNIVYVDQQGDTWAFAVCTNQWQQIDPDGSPADEADLFDAVGQPSGILGPLVYDADSDVTVALNFEYVAVYDANTNAWTRPSNDTIGIGDGLFSPMGAVYDPISGLILTTHPVEYGPPQRWELSAYDVDTNTWSTIGTIPGDIEQLEFLGYSQAIDRFIMGGFVDGVAVTMLLDPRTGETTVVSTETPVVDLVWPSGVYGPAGDTVYVSDRVAGDLALCGFDTASLSWTCATVPDTVPSQYVTFGAAVGDPINDRLVLINGIFGMWWSSAADDVWAIDLDTGEWTQVVAVDESATDQPGRIDATAVDGKEQLAALPWASPEDTHATPQEAVHAFLAFMTERSVLPDSARYGELSLGDFVATGEESGEITITGSEAAFHDVSQFELPFSTAMLRQSDGVWWVTGAVSETLGPVEPAPNTAFAPPMIVSGVNGLFSDAVQLHAYVDGEHQPLLALFFTGGGVYGWGEYSIAVDPANPVACEPATPCVDVPDWQVPVGEHGTLVISDNTRVTTVPITYGG
jgi:hypothetical protein